VKGRLDKYGRKPESMRIIPGCGVYVGRTAAEADELYDELQSLIAPELGVPYLSKLCETDMSKYPLDGPMPDLGTKVLGIASFRNAIVEMAKRDKLTVRQTYERVLPAMGHVTMKGSVKQVCDEIEAWYTEKACDGFNCSAAACSAGSTRARPCASAWACRCRPTRGPPSRRWRPSDSPDRSSRGRGRLKLTQS
jgi:alkanesulfonate monooxygenase SsuD/methylene tetrahydromethanopterin reductase-like flavin-dependent oxidoreductase (luciferase family)